MSEKIVDAKTAVNIAAKYLTDIIKADSEYILVEEIEQIDEDDPVWLVTISYIEPSSSSHYFGQTNRLYKEFKINRDNGDVISMKVKKFD